MIFKNEKDKGVNNSNSMIKTENKIMPRVFGLFKKKDKDHRDKCHDSKSKLELQSHSTTTGIVNSTKSIQKTTIDKTIETALFETKKNEKNEPKNIFSDIFNKVFKKKSTQTDLSLQNFETINLQKLSQRVEWEKRTDIKYIAHISQMDSVLKKLSSGEYLLLKHSGKSVFRYNSEYLDTVDNKMYHSSNNKIRKRYYGEDGYWLEIKEKKSGKLNKYRIFNPTPDETETHIRTHTPYTISDVKSKLFVCYDRMSFVHKTLPLKITVDTNLKYNNDTQSTHFNDVMIIELKSKKNEADSAARMIESLNIKPCSVSKYRIGMSEFSPQLGQYPPLLHMKKISKLKY